MTCKPFCVAKSWKHKKKGSMPIASACPRRPIWGSQWGYLHFFWLCNLKQLNFRYFNTHSTRKIHSNIKFFPERDNNGAKSQIIFLSISRNFRPFSDNSRFFRNSSEDYQRCPKTGEAFLKWKPKIFDFIVVVIFIIMWTIQFYCDQKRFFREKPSKTVNIKKLASLTANTKNYG